MERGANPTLAALAEQTLIQHPPFSMSDLTARNAKHALWAQGTAAYSAFTLHHSSLLSGLCVFSLCALCGKNASSFSSTELTARNAKDPQGTQVTTAHSSLTLHHSSLLSVLCVFSLCALCGKNASSFSSTELTARNAKHAPEAQGTASHSAFILHHYLASFACFPFAHFAVKTLPHSAVRN